MANAPAAATPHDNSTKVDSPSAFSPQGGGGSDVGRQEIRLAVVLNGGVSLAIWISGVTLELHHLAMASRWDETTYHPLLDLLWADARIDVIAGTSAGGLNGAFLALGLTRDRDLTLMRDLWRDHGSLEKLLRDPLRKNPPSLLMGDDYFLPQVRDALARMLDQGSHGPSFGDGGGWPVELILTGTLWQGRTTSFTDDMGAAITEIDHDARFQFKLTADGGSAAGDLASGGLVDQLAAAARCTSSFPAAFEPHFVEVTDRTAAGEGPWSSKAGGANFRNSQYVVDGGVLLNKPIRPALEAIYRQTAEFQVRRILAYVVPDPGEPRPAQQDSSQGDAIPQARDVLLGVLTRLRSTDSVSRELTEIRTRNADAHQRRRARDRLAAAMITTADPLSSEGWPGYIEVRITHASRSIAQLLAAGQQAASGRWSERDLVSALQELLRARRARSAAEQEADPFFIPRGELQDAVKRAGADWDWGATTVQRLGDMAVDMLKRAVWLAPTGSEWQDKIVKARKALSCTLEKIRTDRSSLDAYWSTAPAGATSAGAIPVRETMDALGTATSAATAKLNKWLRDVLDRWDRVPAPEKGAGGRREQLYGQALAVAKSLHDCVAAIDEVAGAPYESADASHLNTEQLQTLARGQDAIDPDGEERKRLRALYNYLLTRPTEAPEHTGAPERSAAAPDPATAPGPELVLKRMLKLDVVQLAFAGASQDVEQEVELVQFSAKQPETLTGVQLHHFGAFYRSSWRMNDWLRGRMDGAAHLVRMLLSTERLRQRAAAMAAELGDTAGQSQKSPTDKLLKAIKQTAISTNKPDLDKKWLEEQWDEIEDECRRFVELILIPKPAISQPPQGQDATLPAADPAAREQELLETCVQAITRSIHTCILRDDLPSLAEAIRSEGNDCADTSKAWLASYDASVTTPDGTLPTDKLWALWQQADQVGKERLTGEVGSDTFARTAAHTAAVAANTIGTPSKPKAVATVLTALRGYALAVWAMVTLLTRKSHFGPRVVELAVAAGGVLLAAAIFVPAMPLAFTLAGVLLLLAGVSAGALLTEDARKVGWRLGACALLVAAALGGYVYWDWTRHGLSGSMWSLLVKVGIGVLVVLLGWWIARAQPRGVPRDRAVGKNAGAGAGAAAGASAGADAGREAGERAGAHIGGEAGEQIGRYLGAIAGADAGREAGASAGAGAGGEAGEQAGQMIRRANNHQRGKGKKHSKADIKAAVQTAVRQAGEQAGRKAGARAGREAGREAGQEAATNAWPRGQA